MEIMYAYFLSTKGGDGGKCGGFPRSLEQIKIYLLPLPRAAKAPHLPELPPALSFLYLPDSPVFVLSGLHKPHSGSAPVPSI